MAVSNPTGGHCVGPESDMAGKASSCAGCPNQSKCASGETKTILKTEKEEVKSRLEEIEHKILVLSGKGGVGKSTFATNLCWALASQDKEVAILDIDICGPSVPHLMGVEDGSVHKSNFGWEPVYAGENDEVAVLSIGFLLNSRSDAVIWRGPKKHSMIKQLLSDTNWGQRNFLIVDTPPGTSDEHISIVQLLAKAKPSGAIIVTTPAEVSLLDVRKEITFCRKTGVKVLGVVSNMAGFVCSCNKETQIFPNQDPEAVIKMCQEFDVPYLGAVPLDPRIGTCGEKGMNFLKKFPESPATKAFLSVVQLIDASLATESTSTKAMEVDDNPSQ